jgi:preprotein translocase subunit SecG
MYVLFSIFIIIVCVILILIVLIQNSKGGGLAAGFASSNQYMGVRKTADFLEKATWTLAGILILLCVVSTITVGHGTEAPKSAIEEQIQNATENPNNVPQFPNAAPQQNGNQNKPASPATPDKQGQKK